MVVTCAEVMTTCLIIVRYQRVTHYLATAIAEISILASRGKRATSTVARAGGAFLMLHRPRSFSQNGARSFANASTFFCTVAACVLASAFSAPMFRINRSRQSHRNMTSAFRGIANAPGRSH